MSLSWPTIIVCAVGISLLLTLLVIPQILHVSLQKRLFDRPASRKVHTGVIPRLGGFAFLPVIIVTLGLVLVFPARYSSSASQLIGSELLVWMPDLVVLFSATMILFLVGLYDDLMGLKYWVKFIAQILVAVMIVEAGEYLVDYEGLFGITHTAVGMGKIITAFLIIYVVNALNLIDGIDGLASGLCVVTLSFFGLILYVASLYLFSLLAWVAAAAMFVFWVFNVFGSKKKHTKIFMGDIGSLSIGLVIAFLVIVVGGSPKAVTVWNAKPLVLALSPLIIPLFDVIRVFCLRIMHGKSPFLPDKRHIHHMMLDAGIPMRTAMSLILLAQITILVVNVAIAEFMNINFILLADVVIYALSVISLNAGRKRAIN